MNGNAKRTESNMSAIPIPAAILRPEIEEAAETMSGLLREQAKYIGRVVGLVRDRHRARGAGDLAECQSCLELEKEAMLDFVLVERERIALLRQIGQELGHRRPSSLRIAELIFHVSPELRDELLDVREELRDQAEELERLRSLSSQLEHHTVGRVTLFLSPDVPSSKSSQWIEPGAASPRSRDLPSDRRRRPA
ncbi:MAG: hypothetical protein JXA90_10550, partial [Planctomycetes bacterium]|nr:hypothetical protein [Planctomycetota bacterium]